MLEIHDALGFVSSSELYNVMSDLHWMVLNSGMERLIEFSTWAMSAAAHVVENRRISLEMDCSTFFFSQRMPKVTPTIGVDEKDPRGKPSRIFGWFVGRVEFFKIIYSVRRIANP